MFTTYVLLLVATVMHLMMDMHKQKTKHAIHHWFSALATIGVSVMIGFMNQLIWEIPFYRFAIYSLCIHFALFDYLWNLFNRKPFFYHGEPSNPNRAWTDKMWDRIPPWGEIFFRLWMIGVGIGVYHHWDLIVGN